jgi:hypothetical protein
MYPQKGLEMSCAAAETRAATERRLEMEGILREGKALWWDSSSRRRCFVEFKMGIRN